MFGRNLLDFTGKEIYQGSINTGFDVGRKTFGLSIAHSSSTMNNPVVQLVELCLSTAASQQYRWYQTRKDLRKDVYQPIYNAEGQFVHAYEFLFSIKEFPYRVLDPIEEHPEWLERMTQDPNPLLRAGHLLKHLKSARLPELVENRDLHAFQNGVLELSTNQFYSFQPGTEEKGIDQLPGNTIARTYHAMSFPVGSVGGCDPVTQLLDSQGFTSDEQCWILAMLGRLLHEPGRHDRWKFVPVFTGPGLGKTLLLRLVRSLFDVRDVRDRLPPFPGFRGVLIGDAECQRGPLPQGVRACLEGEKGRAPAQAVLIRFERAVANPDAHLSDQCQAVLPAFLFTINRAYLALAKEYGDQRFQSVMPKCFKAV